MATARDLVTAERCTVFLIDREKEQLWSKLAQNSAEIRLPMGAGIAGMVAMTGETVNIPDAYADSRFNRSFDIKTGFVTRNILATPMKNEKGEVIGVFQAINKLPEQSSFNLDDETQITSFSTVAASTIGNAIDFGNMQQELMLSFADNDLLHGSVASAPYTQIILNETGRLVQILNPDLLDLRPLIPTMKLTSYEHWLGQDNAQLMTDISRASVAQQEYSATHCNFFFKGDATPRFISYNISPMQASTASPDINKKSPSKYRAKYEDAKKLIADTERCVVITLRETTTADFTEKMLSKQLAISSVSAMRNNPVLSLESGKRMVTVLKVDIRGCDFH